MKASAITERRGEISPRDKIHKNKQATKQASKNKQTKNNTTPPKKISSLVVSLELNVIIEFLYISQKNPNISHKITGPYKSM